MANPTLTNPTIQFNISKERLLSIFTRQGHINQVSTRPLTQLVTTTQLRNLGPIKLRIFLDRTVLMTIYQRISPLTMTIEDRNIRKSEERFPIMITILEKKNCCLSHGIVVKSKTDKKIPCWRKKR